MNNLPLRYLNCHTVMNRKFLVILDNIVSIFKNISSFISPEITTALVMKAFKTLPFEVRAQTI